MKFPDGFATLLGQEVDLFRELEVIQGRALVCVQAGTFGDLGTLLERQREVLEGLEGKRRELQPYMQDFESMSPDEKSALRQGPVGALLAEVESAAAKIQSRHRAHFDAPMASVDHPLPAGAAAGDDLEMRISRFRAGS